MPEEKDKQEGEEVAEPETKSKSQGLVDDAKGIAERIEAANKKTEELLTRQEELRTTEILSGGSDAGQEPKPKKEISDKEYADKVMAGEIPDED